MKSLKAYTISGDNFPIITKNYDYRFVSFTHRNLDFTTFEDVTFDGCNFAFVSAKNSKFVNCKFISCCVMYTTFYNSVMKNCYLNGEFSNTSMPYFENCAISIEGTSLPFILNGFVFYKWYRLENEIRIAFVRDFYNKCSVYYRDLYTNIFNDSKTHEKFVEYLATFGLANSDIYEIENDRIKENYTIYCNILKSLNLDPEYYS